MFSPSINTLIRLIIVLTFSSTLLTGCVMVEATSTSQRSEASQHIGWMVKGCLAIHNHDLRAGDAVVIHARDNEFRDLKGTISSRANDAKGCDPLLEDRKSVNLLTGAAFYHVAVPDSPTQPAPELSIVTLDKGFSTRGLDYHYCFTSKGVNFSVVKGGDAIWQGYYFVATQIPATCKLL